MFMNSSLLRVSKEKLNVLYTVQLATCEHNCVQDLCYILEPFQVATDMVQGERSVTDSLVIPCIHGLRRKPCEVSSNFNNKLVQTLQKALDRGFSALEDRVVYVMASTFDSWFKLKCCSNEHGRATTRDFLLILHTRCHTRVFKVTDAANFENIWLLLFDTSEHRVSQVDQHIAVVTCKPDNILSPNLEHHQRVFQYVEYLFADDIPIAYGYVQDSGLCGCWCPIEPENEDGLSLSGHYFHLS